MTLRMDDDTRAAVERAAAARQITAAEYMRRAIIVQIAWDQALRAVKAGANPDVLLSQQEFAEVLARLAAESND